MYLRVVYAPICFLRWFISHLLFVFMCATQLPHHIIFVSFKNNMTGPTSAPIDLRILITPFVSSIFSLKSNNSNTITRAKQNKTYRNITKLFPLLTKHTYHLGPFHLDRNNLQYSKYFCTMGLDRHQCFYRSVDMA